MKQERTIRYSYCKPSILNKEPFGTEWIINDSNGHYIQLSRDKERPVWKTIGELLYIIHMKQLGDPKFIDSCLHTYSNNSTIRF